MLEVSVDVMLKPENTDNTKEKGNKCGREKVSRQVSLNNSDMYMGTRRVSPTRPVCLEEREVKHPFQKEQHVLWPQSARV